MTQTTFSCINHNPSKSNPENSADILFKEIGSFSNRKREVYSEKQLIRKVEKDIQWDSKFDYAGISNQFSEALSNSMIAGAVKAARLSKIEEMSLKLYSTGLSIRQSAELLKISRSKANSILIRTIKKLRLASKTDPYLCWYQVYLQEINRHKKCSGFRIIR